MAERARHLQEMLTHPFGKPQTKSDRSGISHLDWHLGSSIPFHWEQNFDRAKGLAAAALDVSQQSNAFLGNTLEPSGWAPPPPEAVFVEDVKSKEG